MVSVRHKVVVEPVPYPWLVDALAVIRTLAEESQADAQGLVLPDGQVIPDIRLTQGRHLRPGSVYLTEAEVELEVELEVEDDDGDDDGDGDGEAKADADADADGSGISEDAEASETVQITVREWDHRRAVRLELALASDAMNVELDAALKSPDRPSLVELSGRAGGGAAARTLFGMAGRARVRLDDWWPAADTDRIPPSAPASARLDHPWIRADVRAVPRPSRDDGRWEIHVTVSLRGRRLLRPVAAVVLAVAARRIRRSVVQALDNQAAQWNDRVPHLVSMNPDQLRETLLSKPSGENGRHDAAETGTPGTPPGRPGPGGPRTRPAT
ncbi:hypothetical protein ACIQCF_25535 [Streptomyces sp. NPDC088353]|uniref:hypothetical protein n=1 Tax=Streptomyces sp. NPDC088353 TaxID=3365855 RepID=UPI00382EC0BC